MSTRADARKVIGIAALVAGLAACGDGGPVTPVLEEGAPVAEASQAHLAALPFHGATRGWVTAATQDPSQVSALCGPGYHMYAAYVGSGVANHLGRFTLSIWTCIELVNRTWFGDAVFTAADGDALAGSVAGTAEWVDEAAMVASWEVVGFHIHQGTGRFAGAVLEGSWVGGVAFLAGTAWSTLDGTITYDASDRRP